MQNLLPESGWHPMVDADHDMSQELVVRFHEYNKPNAPYRVQLARWACNMLGQEWCWRPAHRLDGGIAYADGWMTVPEFQKACEALAREHEPEFDL